MGDLLGSLGIGSKVDPSLYANQKEVAGQLVEAKGDMTSTLGSVNTALSVVSMLPGIPDDMTSTLTSLKDQAQGMVDSTTASPDQIEAKRQKIESDLADVMAKKDELVAQAALKDAKDATETIQKRVAEIEADKTTSQDLLRRYRALLADARATQADAQATLTRVTKKKEGFQSMGPATAGAPLFKTPDELLVELATLNEMKEDEEDKVFSWSRFGWRIWGMVSKALFYGAMALGAAMGGVILSNTYMSTGYWGTRLFYFVYGAAFFPLVLLYGLISPPVWYASIAPLYPKDLSKPAGMFDALFSYQMYDAVKDADSISSDKITMRIISGVCLAVFGLIGGVELYKKYSTPAVTILPVASTGPAPA